MGSRGDAGGSGGNTGADAGFFISESKKKSKLSKKNQDLVDAEFNKRGNVKIDQTQILTPTTAVFKGAFKKGSEVNRNFFTDKVLGSKNYKGTTKEDFANMTVSQQESIYGDYMKGRQEGRTDAYGNPISGGGGNDNNNQPILTSAETLPANNMTTTAPTNAEVTQASSTTMSADEILVANKKKGRSQTILNQAQGLGNSNANITKKTLGA